VDIPVSNARHIGECIYCGSRQEPLSKEHAVPYGLNGPWTLLAASCEACARVTHRFERDTMRCLWPEIRNALAMQSRRAEKRASDLPLTIQKDGVREIVLVPRSEYPVYLPVPLFPQPGVFWAPRPIRGVFTNLDLIHIAGPTFEDASTRYPGANFVGMHTNFSPEEFARMLAKIGYCVGVAALGLRAFANSPIKKVILGSDPCIGHWVGNWYGDPINGTRGGLHEIRVELNSLDLSIHVFIRLFAQFTAPEYHVVLGRADPMFVASDQWPAHWPVDDSRVNLGGDSSS